jgi:hypothetical protein
MIFSHMVQLRDYLSRVFARRGRGDGTILLQVRADYAVTQAHARSTAVFVDELDSSQLQGAPDRQIVSRRQLF